MSKRSKQPISDGHSLHHGAEVVIGREKVGILINVEVDSSHGRWTKMITDRGHELSSNECAVVINTPERIVIVPFVNTTPIGLRA